MTTTEKLSLTNESIDKLNERLEREHFGWYFDYDKGYDSHFLSVYDSNNYKDELFFLVDLNEDTSEDLVTYGLRFKASGKSLVLKDTHPTYLEAKTIAGFIKGIL